MSNSGFQEYQDSLTPEQKKQQQREATEASVHSRKIRELYKKKLISGSITFHELVKMSQDPGLKPLRRMRVISLLASFSGWEMKWARYAFFANELPESLRVQDCYNEERSDIVSMLMNSSASTWQRRPKAPEGWPWHGNIAAALADLDRGDLPQEAREVRWRFASEIKSPEPEKELTPQEASAQVTEALGGMSSPQDDGLDDLFNDGLDDVDDGLDDLLDDDDDDFTSEDIEDFLRL